MGTTLSNGVYLPDEGERNCYAGLKVNWEILNQKVADISALQLAIAGALHRKIVASLPTTDIDPNTIYMILSGTSATENVYNEFMYVNNAWELIGTSATDLTNYYTKAEVDGKLLLKANASDLTSHTGDTTIHVTASDKNRWNNQTYVFRYSSTALVDSSTNSNSLLDNTDNLKVGDKVIDSSGVLFSITAIDTQNSTFTIGTALIDLAQDSDIVHNSGDETISGFKTFSSTIRSTAYPSIRMYLSDDEWNVQPASGKQSEIRFTDKNSVTVSYFAFQHRTDSAEPFRTCWRQHKMDGTSGYYSVDFNNKGDFYPENNNAINLGGSGNRWKSVYATNYYYGLNNVEFSTKFVTTDTAQDIEGNKNFKGLLTTIPDDTIWPVTASTTDDITYLGANAIHVEQKSSGKLTDLSGGAWSVAELGVGCFFFRINNGTDIRYKHLGQNTVNRIPVVSGANRFINDVTPNQDNTYNLGSSSLRWKTINGLNPSSLSLPDLANGIDISSYIDVTQTSQYTAPADGYISICGYATSTNAILIKDHDYDFAMTFRALTTSLGATTYFVMPVIKNHVYDISCSAVTNIAYAKFFPCQGNV